MSVGETILTLKQQEDMLDLVIEMANGYFINAQGNRQRLVRTDCIDKAREFLLSIGVSWKRPGEAP